jgi:hypothetical protein
MAVAEVPAVSLDDVVCVAPTQVSSQVGDEVAILHMDKAVYYGLNPVGARIWQLVQQPVAVRKVLETLLEEYDVEPETAERDLLEIVEQLMAAGLVERRDASAA